MSESKQDSYETLEGAVQISNEVIAVIAGTAALEVDGVSGLAGNITGGISEMLWKKNLSKGIKVTVEEKEVIISLQMVGKFGYNLQEVAENVQKRVSVAVETMTGLQVKEVNVAVSGLFVEKEKGPKEN